jgi:hypothetical protein
MKRSKLKLNRETLATLDGARLRAAGGDCTCQSCTPTCGATCPCPPATYDTCYDTCVCPTGKETNCTCY